MGPFCARHPHPWSLWRGPAVPHSQPHVSWRAGRRGSQPLYELQLSPAARTPNGVVPGAGEQETPGSRARRRPSTCLPPTEPPPQNDVPWQRPPHGCHLDHMSHTSFETSRFLCSSRSTPPLLALKTARAESLQPISCVPRAPSPSASRGAGHTTMLSGGLCPPGPPEMPSAPLGAKEKPSPASSTLARPLLI